VPKLTGEWRKYTAVLTTGSVAPTPDGRFAITASTPGSFNVTEVSLFPPTYHNRPNGDRVDLSEKLAAMHPRLLRFPGGNYLEGNTIAERFEWKNTIGPIDQRPGHWGPWGYRSSDGMGLAEFLGWCDDLHMEPLLAVYAGFSLAGNRQPDPQIVKPGPALQPFVQDALDEIEYVIGDKSTKWGGVRARDGHPAPYKLEYVEIGNEDFFDGTGSYDGRFAQFYDAIKARYPHLKLIATTTVHNRTPDLYDEHYYRSPAAMEKDATHYDSYDRHGPKVFVGEWASQEGQPTPDMNSALGDAAWMTGLERNTDVVLMNTYAPLLVNVNPGGRQWGTNLIGYDSLTSFGSPSYYAQVMFASNLGDVTLPVDLSIPQYEPAVDTHPKGRIGVGTWRTQAEFKDIKVTHAGQTLYAKDFASGDSDWQLGTGNWQVVDGALRQTGDGERCWAVAGDPSWTDYTLTLKARKISGAEGFLIRFHDIDDANWVWWNVGGWGNTRTQLQRSVDGNQFEIGPSSKATVETGRWYDIKVDVDGPNIRCYLDGKLVTEAVDAAPTPPESAYASAMLDRRSGDVILKVVNIAADPQDIAISLDGLVPHGTSSRHTVHAIVLSGEPRDVNTIDDPTKVVPHKSFFKVDGSRFQHTFPAHSVTVLRIHE
jgi:alpha-L-arabinofuranosidase